MAGRTLGSRRRIYSTGTVYIVIIKLKEREFLSEEREMNNKKHYRDRVDVRFDDRFRFNRHREGAEKERRENCVEHAGGEIIITILNHICTSSSRNVYYVTRAEF